MLTPMILVCVVYTIIDTFNNPSYGIGRAIGSPLSNNVPIGMAAAMSWVYFAIVALLLYLTYAIIARRVSYLD
jgi:ABC-type spermidine/putrescine transport system permease subunit I